jgi:hypothetical protein
VTFLTSRAELPRIVLTENVASKSAAMGASSIFVRIMALKGHPHTSSLPP